MIGLASEPDASPTESPTEVSILNAPAPTDQEPKQEASDLELCGGVIALTAWTFVFAVGIVFPSTPIRDALTGMGVIESKGMLLAYLCAFLLTYTVSNVAVLCCISAWLGELGRRTRIDGAANGVAYRRGDYMAAVMRGFLGYLAVLTGYVIIGSGVNAFVTPSPEQFVRLAAIVSLAGFLIGFNPEVFNRFATSVTSRIVTEQRPDGSVTRLVENTSQTGPSPSPASQGGAGDAHNGTVPNSDRIVRNNP